MKEMRIKKIPLPLGEGWVRVEGLLPSLLANSTLTRLAPLARLSQWERRGSSIHRDQVSRFIAAQAVIEHACADREQAQRTRKRHEEIAQ